MRVGENPAEVGIWSSRIKVGVLVPHNKFSPHLIAVIILETVCTSDYTSRKRIGIYRAMLHALMGSLEA